MNDPTAKPESVPEPEREVRHILLDGNFPSTIEQWRNDGWEYDLTAPPVVVYHLVRRPKPPVDNLLGATAKMTIDESKVGILRAGTDEIEWGDGSTTKVAKP